MATAQKEPSQLQKDLLAAKLVGSEFPLPQAEELCDSAVPRLEQSDRLEQSHDSGRPRLQSDRLEQLNNSGRPRLESDRSE